MTDPTHGQDGQDDEACPSENCATECDNTCMARERNALNSMCASESAHGGHVWYDGQQRPRECPGYVGRAGVPRDQGDRLRAAQIQAALTTMRGHEVEWCCHPASLAEQLVDAVLAAGRDDHDRFAGSALQDPEVRRGYRDQAEARGYAKAVANLVNLARYDAWVENTPDYEGWRVWSTASRHGLADYLEAVGPGADETVRARGGVVQGAPPIEEIGPPGFAWPNVRVDPSLPEGRILFVSPRHVHAIAYDTAPEPPAATQSAQDGSGVGRSGGEGGTGAEQYPGQLSTPKNGCPVCGGPLRVAMVEVTNGPHRDFIPGRWDCPRGCDPRQAVAEDADG